MMYGLLADGVVAIHVMYVGYVVVGLLLVLAGWVGNWQWVRNPWFRFSHLVMILIVAGESLANVTCPLTTWENQLRAMGGDLGEQGSFIGRGLRWLLFYECTDDHWAFPVAYVSFALLVALTFWLMPVRVGKKPAEGGMEATAGAE